MSTTAPDLKKVTDLAIDLRTGFPRSAVDALADYAIAARAIDKCRAELAGVNGEYHYACPLTKIWSEYAGIDLDELRTVVATGATDAEIASWITQKATKRERIEILRWTQSWREKKVSELDPELMTYMVDYVAENCPPGSWTHIKTWFDIYDIEEQRITV